MNTPLQQAAQAVIDRWDSPLWKDQPQTGVYIAELRKALADEQAQAVEPVAWMHPSRDPHLVSHSAYTYGSASVPLYAHPATYDQQALELCDKCGWKAIMPGEPCLNCSRGEVMKALDAYAAERDALASLDAQRLESLRALEAERNAALAQIETMTKDPSWFALKAERDALAADAGRYRWLRRSATKLSFDNALIGSLVMDQSELDGAMEAA